MVRLKQSLPAIGTVLAVLFLGAPAQAAPLGLAIQTGAVQANAAPGDASLNFANAAIFVIVVTNLKTGKPVDNLGGNVGNSSGVIALPPGWNLTRTVIAAGGAVFAPIQFINDGSGKYRIFLAPGPGSPAWVAGDYVFVLRFTDGSGSSARDGSALGILHIQ